MRCWFDGATVILSGASSGIGLELARLLILRHGCRVVGIGRRAGRLQSAADELGERFICRPFDVTAPGAWDDFVLWLGREGIKPDILINNAGVLPPFAAFKPDGGAQALRKTVELNFLSQVTSCGALLPLLLESPRGAVINVSSSASLASLPGTGAYSAGKAASRAFTQCLSLEYRRRLYVASVCPGFTRTPLFDAQPDRGVLTAELAMPPERMARGILRGIRRRRRLIVRGADAHAMSILYRVFGTAALDLFSWVFRISGLEMFSECFADDEAD